MGVLAQFLYLVQIFAKAESFTCVLDQFEAVMRRAGRVARRSGPRPWSDRLPAAGPSPRRERYDNFLGRPQLS